MQEFICEVRLGNKTYPMLYSLRLVNLMKRRYKGLHSVGEVLYGPTINEFDDEETKAEKLKKREEAAENVLDELPWLVSELIQTAYIAMDNPEKAPSPDYVMALMMPGQIQSISAAVGKAFQLGSESEQPEEGPRDPVLDELKNVKAAADN